MKSAMSIGLLAAVALLHCISDRTHAGVVVHWAYETAGSTPVTVGQVATGQVDDTGGHTSGPYHATGHGGTLSYQIGVLGTGHSIQLVETTSPIDYVDLAMPAAVADIAQGAFTIETWFKTTDTGRGVLVGTYDGAADDINFEIYNGNLRGHIASGGSTTSFFSSGHASVADGKWHHAAFVREGASGTVLMYLDGLQVASATDVAGAFTLARPTLYLGRDGRTGSTRFSGYLDQTRISDTALTPNQFVQVSGIGEQNYYRMETDGGIASTVGQAANVVDDTGLHPFTYNGAARPSANLPTYGNDVPGRLVVRDGVETPNASSLSFNGAGAYVELGDQPLLETLPQDDFTIEFFLKTPLRNDRSILVGTYDGSTRDILNLEIGGAGANQGHLRAFLESTARTDFYGATSISDNEWHHVALVRSGAGSGSDSVQLYVDYELDGQRALNTGVYSIRSDFFRLGRDSRAGGYYYEGLLDEFRISRGALDVSEFLQAVPEPSSLLMVIFGLIGLAALGRGGQRKERRH